jgi:tetratricopeptide (TPR) repeat protein
MTITVQCPKCLQSRDVPSDRENAAFYCYQCGALLWTVDPETGVRWRATSATPDHNHQGNHKEPDKPCDYDAPKPGLQPELVPSPEPPPAAPPELQAARTSESKLPACTQDDAQWRTTALCTIALLLLMWLACFLVAISSQPPVQKRVAPKPHMPDRNSNEGPFVSATKANDYVDDPDDNYSAKNPEPGQHITLGEDDDYPFVRPEAEIRLGSLAGDAHSGGVETDFAGVANPVEQPEVTPAAISYGSVPVARPQKTDISEATFNHNSRSPSRRYDSLELLGPRIPTATRASSGADSPQQAAHHYASGLDCFNRGDMAAAIEEYSEVLRVYPSHVNAHYGRGLAYENIGDVGLALEDYNMTLQIDARHAAAYLCRGNVFRKVEDFDDAIDNYTQCVTLDPSNVTAYNNRGNTYYMKGNFEAALRDLNLALRLDSRYVRAYVNRSLVYRKLGASARAEKDIDMARHLGWKQ